jgi:hypothetical protein
LSCFDHVHLCVDRRNPEYHDQAKFDAHLENQIAFERAARKLCQLRLNITHLHHKSSDGHAGPNRAQIDFGIRGVQAADFICWAVKRKYENNDERWYSIIAPCLEPRVALYF